MRREVVRMPLEMWQDLAFAIVTYTLIRSQLPDPAQYPKRLPSYIRAKMAYDRGVPAWWYRVAQRRLRSNRKFRAILQAICESRCGEELRIEYFKAVSENRIACFIYMILKWPSG